MITIGMLVKEDFSTRFSKISIKVIFVNKMNITFVSALYNIDNNTNSEKLLQDYEKLASSNLKLILFTDSSFKFLEKENVKIVEIPLNEVVIYSKIMKEKLLLPSKRNAEKDTQEYMALMNSKVEFLLKALEFVDTEYVGWIDAGINKIFSTSNIFNKISKYQIKDLDKILIPGAYQRQLSFNDLVEGVWWVFLGGFFILPKILINRFYNISLESINEFINKRRLAWEVNVWVDIASKHDIFEWYKADHNDTIVDVPLKFLDFDPSDINFVIKQIVEARTSGNYLHSYNLSKNVLKREKDPFSKINLELAASCLPLQKYDEGRLACERYLESSGPANVKNMILGIISSYITQPIKHESNKKIEYKLPNGYFPSSPSIIQTENGLLCNMRAVNYTIRPNGSYDIRDANNVVRTKNFLLSLTQDFDVIKDREISDNLHKLEPRFPSHIKGLEDMRIFTYKNQNYFFATCCETLNFFCPRIVFGSFNSDGEIIFIQALKIPNNDNNTCEKNWLPFVWDDEICLIYKISPLTIYSINYPEGFELKLKLQRDSSNDYEFRGSAPPIPYENGWLLTIHQVHYSTPRKYYHRFLWYNKDFTERKYSELFVFEKPQIEYNLSIVHINDKIIMGYSINDGSSQIMSISQDQLKNMLTFSHYLTNNHIDTFPDLIPARKSEGKKICLCMIVKNESKIIERCLQSCLPILDYISICDTGSTDNTVEIINNFCIKNGIPGKVHNHTWKNFGHNRTLSYQAAKEAFPDADYCLLIDADMCLKVLPDFDKSKLTAGNYLVAQLGGTLYYFNTRLINTKYNWKCVGVTHEYWSAEDSSCVTQQLLSLEMMDLGDGGCKADKFERDIRLLTQGLIDEPNNSRYMFYLAQSYHDIGEFKKAIKAYRRRIKAGGWYEEVYYSYYRIAKCKEGLKKNWSEIEQAYLDAHKYLPSRMEPLYEIGKYYQENEKYKDAYKWLKEACKIPFPQNQILFIFKDIYEFRVWDSLGISAYYVGEYQESINACIKALKSSYCGHNTERIKNNMRFSINKLKKL